MAIGTDASRWEARWHDQDKVPGQDNLGGARGGLVRHMLRSRRFYERVALAVIVLVFLFSRMHLPTDLAPRIESGMDIGIGRVGFERVHQLVEGSRTDP